MYTSIGAAAHMWHRAKQKASRAERKKGRPTAEWLWGKHKQMGVGVGGGRRGRSKNTENKKKRYLIESKQWTKG